MYRIFNLRLSLMLLFSTNLLAQNQSAILGKWIDENQETIIEINIHPTKNTFYGKIIWVKDSLDAFGEPLRDVLNDNTNLRSRKVLGTNMLEDFEWDGEESWRKGKIYYYQSGNDYNGKIWLTEDDELKLKGYYSILFFLGRTKTWKRVKANESFPR